ncbi:CBS domain-containing protein [Nitrosopumilus sp.]|uniref:CBS domain-containing protein n=1 Tax=Nitrosopumilus sp. TaxID=2024843 RepID=UPI00247D51F9|nr:CBS domain-containing protein [Nitrosopumilus sp.]MCV0411090.1 CBS domain-containing protein [Nitrosopumilus sp.]
MGSTDKIYGYLADIQSAKIKPLITKAITVKPSDIISGVIDKISKNDSYDVFHFNGKSTLSTNTRLLLDAKNISKTSIESLLYSIPHVGPNDTIQKAAKIISDYRTREAPVVENNKIIGSITAKKILGLLSKKGNKSIKAKMIYTKNPITISAEKPLSNAKKIMTSKRLDHLPVIKNGRINQVLTPAHIIEYLAPQERQGNRSVGIKTAHKLEFEIGNIGSTRIPQCSPDDDLGVILSSMLKTDTSCCLVKTEETLEGIITFRDILELFSKV